MASIPGGTVQVAQGSGASMISLAASSGGSVTLPTPHLSIGSIAGTSPGKLPHGGGGEGSGGSPGPGQGGHTSGQLNLLQRVVAVESLAHMAAELRAGKAAILVSDMTAGTPACVPARLAEAGEGTGTGMDVCVCPWRALRNLGPTPHPNPTRRPAWRPHEAYLPARRRASHPLRLAPQAAMPSRSHREVEQYFSRTVEAAGDLRATLFRGAARQLMQGVWEGDRGIPAAIAVTNYNVKASARWLLCSNGSLPCCVG